MRKCPYCGSEKWHHYRGGATCVRIQLYRIKVAIADFRIGIYEDTFLPDEIREAVLERLDSFNGEPTRRTNMMKKLFRAFLKALSWTLFSAVTTIIVAGAVMQDMPFAIQYACMISPLITCVSLAMIPVYMAHEWVWKDKE